METQAVETQAVETSAIARLIADGEMRAAEIERQNEAKKQERADQERLRIAELWQPILEKLSAALPAWVALRLWTPPATEPETLRHGCTEYNPVTLMLDGLAPIRVYVGGNQIGYSVPQASLALDEYGDDGWQAHYTWPDYSVTCRQIQDMTNDLAVACYQAVVPAMEYAALQIEAERRNREVALRPAPPKPEPPAPTALEEAKTHFRAGAWDSAAIWVAIAQAEALTRLAEVAEVAETLLEAGQLERTARIWGS